MEELSESNPHEYSPKLEFWTRGEFCVVGVAADGERASLISLARKEEASSKPISNI